MGRAADHAAEGLEAAAGIACDILLPGFRQKFEARRREIDGAGEHVEPDPARDVEVKAEIDPKLVCVTCDGEGELRNIRGRIVSCGGCLGTGRAK